MKKTCIAILAGVLAFAGIAFADVLPPGQKVVPVCASFSNTASMLDTMAVYGYETGVTGQKVDLSSFIDGECFKPGYKFNTYKVYGVKAAHALQINTDTYDPSNDPEAYPASIQPEMGYMYVDSSSTLDNVKNIYKIIGFDETNHLLTIVPDRTEKYDSTSQTPTVIEGSVTSLSGEIIPGTQETGTQQTTGAVFSDVPSDSPYFAALTYLKDNNIVSGYPDGTFKPGDTINRAEFTKIVAMAVYPETQDCAATTPGFNFPDVDKTAWYADFICTAFTNKVIAGYPDGTFRPSQEINFAEAAKIIAGAFGLKVTPGGPWYKAYIDVLASKNAIPTTVTAFNQNITRGEMAEIIYRIKAGVTGLPSQKYSDLK